MPELLSHTISAYLLKSFLPTKETVRKGFPLILFGVFLPDLVSRGVVLISHDYYYQAQFFHTPFACVIQSMIISLLFIKQQRLLVFKSLTLGWILHQVFDLFQESLDPFMYAIFWPLSLKTFSLGIFWHGHWPFLALSMAILLLLITKIKINSTAS